MGHNQRRTITMPRNEKALRQQGPGETKTVQADSTANAERAIPQGRRGSPGLYGSVERQRPASHWEEPLEGYGHDWRQRTIEAHKSGLLDGYEARRIFRLHNATFSGAA